MRLKRSLITLLITYVLVIIVNVTANYEIYQQRDTWRQSISFSLMVATIAWVGYMWLYHFIFSRYFTGSKNPNATLIYTVLASGLYGTLMMLLVMKFMVWFMGDEEQSLFNYTNNAMYAALFAMLLGLLINGQDFLSQLKSSAEENERMKKELLQGQFEVLKNQVNPHFFFNMLNTLVTLIPEDPKVAVAFVQQLSRVFRYSLQTGQEETVSVSTELKVLEAFVFLNKQRFEDKLSVHINIAGHAKSSHIVVQSLLMLFENALKHNEISTLYPLTVRIYNEEEKYIVVENTFQPKTQAVPSTGIGLKNIISRYGFLTEKPVIVERQKNFTVKLPLLKYELTHS